MSSAPVVVRGTLQPDGSLRLDEAPDLPPGPVVVTLQAVAEPEESRLVRGSLDESTPRRISIDDALTAKSSRLIRLTLDDGATAYGPLTDGTPRTRKVRTTLD